MVPNITIFLIFVTVSSVASQTFQYSRGWTNGKRDGHKREDVRDVGSNLEKILNPCQINKLKYVLEGKPFNERLFAPCDYVEDDDNQPKRYKNEHSTDLFDAFQNRTTTHYWSPAKRNRCRSGPRRGWWDEIDCFSKIEGLYKLKTETHGEKNIIISRGNAGSCDLSLHS